MENGIKEFFGPESIATFTGATGIVWVICSAYRILMRSSPVWVFFIVAMIVAYAGSYVAGTLHGVLGIFLGFVNGCLLFCTSAGFQEGATNALRGKAPGEVKLQGDDFRFLNSWFK